MKDKIGLVLAHHNTNYGALLQAFATQRVIESLGFDTTIIDYKSNNSLKDIKFDWGLIPFLWNRYKNRIRVKTKDFDEIHLQNQEQRKLKKTEFEETMLHNIHLCNGYDRLKNFASEFKAILIGSDQMWLPGVSFGNYLSLRFVPANVRSISYATSLGVSEYPLYCNQSARKMFRKINYLSVREEQGKNIIQSLAPEAEVEVVCDPTYLMTKEEWLKSIPYKKMADEKYILCYFLGNSVEQMTNAKRLAESKGLKCYSILSDESMNEIDTTFPDKTIIGSSVHDFVNLIRNAECVITDSFHGLAFSVINETPFYIYYRKRDDAIISRNSRIDNILRMWGLENQLIGDNNRELKELPTIDYDVVSQKVDLKRKESMKFLKTALTF